MGLERINRPLLIKRGLRGEMVATTSAQTIGRPDSFISLATTSTGANVVYTVAAPNKGGGDFLCVGVDAVGATSAGANFHLNAGSGITFDGSNDMITLSTAGAGVVMVSQSSERWIIMAGTGVALSTST